MTDATDLAIDRFPAALQAQRLLATPEEEVKLAMRPDPRKETWLNPLFGTIFVLTNTANDLVRIGCTARLRKSFTTFNANSPVELGLAHFVHVAGMPVAKRVEFDLHAALLAERRRGEWFEISLAAAGVEIAGWVGRKHLRFWTEPERRKIGALAAQVEARRG